MVASLSLPPFPAFGWWLRSRISAGAWPPTRGGWWRPPLPAIFFVDGSLLLRPDPAARSRPG
jgi:hypothetical protein